jgi:F-box/leucine-rich repeat protein 14
MESIALLPLQLILDFANDYAQTSAVCRRWRTIVPNGCLALKSSVSDDVLAKGLVSLEHVQRLTMVHCGALTDEGAAHLTQCRSLIAIALTHNDNVGVKTAQALASLSSMRRINLYMCRGIDDIAVLNLCTNSLLERLVLGGAPLTNRSVSIIAQALPYVADLELGYFIDGRHCRSITDSAVERLSRLTCLTSLILNGCSVTDNSVMKLTTLTNLLHLGLADLCGQTPLSTDALTLLASHCTKLTNVNLNGAQIDAGGVRSLTRAARSLQSVQLNDNHLLDDEAVACLAALPQLELLWIGGLHLPGQLTDASLTVLAGASRLDDLHLECSNFSANSVSHMRNLSPNLTALTIEGTSVFLSNTSGWDIVTSFPELRHLQVMDTHISADHVEMIARRVTSLRCLHLHAVTLTRESAALIGALELDHLELHGGEMEPGSLGQLTRLSHLDSLLLSNFWTVTDAELAPLAQLRLNSLELRNTMVTNANELSHLNLAASVIVNNDDE